MSDKNEMPKAYEAREHEDQIYAAWLESGYFTPENLPDLEARTKQGVFSMVLPPPNVTGTLHMGHAVMLALEDAMVRLARLQGQRALWVPGTDHAAIATQSKVEKIIQKEEGKTRHDLGREEFLKRVNKFAQDSHDTIVNQAKKMGASLDWSREAYTLDDKRSLAVRTAFRKLYDLGLIYRGHRVVNWDPVGQTTIADDEIVYKEVKAKLYTFRYGQDFPIAISTTRPETKVGDTAVAVNPKDERYQKLIGREFDVDFAGSKLHIRIVGDESVDAEFGTGALGVTPAHSSIDADIAKRHELPMVQVIGEDARMLSAAGSLVVGQSTLEARETIVAWLKEHDLLESEQEVDQNISTAERTGGIVEPLPKLQWFIDVNKKFSSPSGEASLKELMIKAVKDGEVTIVPDRFNKTYFHWIDNLRDWCISRQIWFGHRVPVWYRGEEIVVGEAPAGDGWSQDEDTLDTWFSSGLWTFSTLGWPDESAPDFKLYHPTTILETGYDIIFFWVARMILMSEALLGVAPFKTVYLHGLVRDEQGRKMSKSLDNIIDPLDMIAKYGADATRLSLTIGATPGNDSKLSEEKVAGFRNFTNKLWNISRFVFMTVGEVRHVEELPTSKTLADRWLLGRLAQVIGYCEKHAANHDYSLYGETLREFTWSDFADWYLEIAKVEKDKDEILLYVLERLLILWHPFMPFVTEEIYKQFDHGLIMVAAWPKVKAKFALRERVAMERLQKVITDIRNLRAEYKVEPKVLVEATVLGSDELESCTEVIKSLARVSNLSFGPAKADAAKVSTDLVAVYLQIDVTKEKARLTEELAQLERYRSSLEGKLANADFVARAPEAVVTAERQKLAEAEGKIAITQNQLQSLP